MAAFVSTDGEVKLEAVDSLDHGQAVEVWLWSAGEWLLTDEIRWPPGLGFKRQVDFIAGRLRPYIGTKDMIEGDDPEWVLDAMEG